MWLVGMLSILGEITRPHVQAYHVAEKLPFELKRVLLRKPKLLKVGIGAHLDGAAFGAGYRFSSCSRRMKTQMKTQSSAKRKMPRSILTVAVK